MINVKDMMTPNPISLSKFNTLSDARKLMEERRFRHVPITDEHRQLLGLVTQRNVLDNAVSKQNMLDDNEREKIESGILLADIMTTELTTVTPDINISQAAHIVHQKKFGCLPVIDHDRKLIGIITDHDFVEITINLLEMMDQSEPLELEL